MSQIRKHSIKGITDVLASTDAASKSYFDSINKLSPEPSGFDYNTTIVENNYSSSNFDNCSMVRGISISSNLIFIFSAAFEPLLKNKPQILKKIIKMYFTCD